MGKDEEETLENTDASAMGKSSNSEAFNISDGKPILVLDAFDLANEDCIEEIK